MLPKWEDGKEKVSIFEEELELAYKQLGQLSLQKKQIEEQEEEIDFKIRAILSTAPLRDFEKREKAKDEGKEAKEYSS
tara:strand:- start:1397 stop:1630 length:234 start_codon:yes stop_codon:yes gene_type:complete